MKVFISSTYLDLIEHRKAVVNALRTMGEEVDHMEIFGARDEEPTKASLDELDKCEVLVGIYAYRYGTVPKGSKDSKVSVTEQEYIHATSKKIPILVFVVNEDCDWSPKKMDESLTKIKKFKAKATKEHTPEYFTSPDNLAAKVVASIGRLAKKLYPKPTVSKSIEANDDFGSLNDNLVSEDSRFSKLLWECRDTKLLNQYFETCVKYDPTLFANLPNDIIATRTYLVSSGLIGQGKDGQYYLTDTGVLFCCQRQYIPRNIFHVHVKLKYESDAENLNEELFGSVLYLYYEIYEKLTPLFKRRLGSPDMSEEFGSEELYYEYPEIVMKEVLANFLIHRDYHQDDKGFITVFPDRIEFVNPGKSSISPDKLLSAQSVHRPSSKRNPRITEAMNKARYNQDEGGGIIRIRIALDKNKSYGPDGKLGIVIENDDINNRFRMVIYKRDILLEKIIAADQLRVISEPVGSSLPNQPFFFGRANELTIIAAAISPESRTWGALIDGPGGIGKTALAIKAAHDAPEKLFERKIFIAAKVRELTPEGEQKLTDFTHPTYLTMLDELGKELGEDLSRLAPDDRPNALRLALAGKKALVVFDNLETLPEDERTRLFQFLSRLPEGNKAIVTSRRRTDVDARIVRLDRLARDEAMQLIAELAQKYPRLARASQKEREDLYEVTQGNPLFIRWIAGQLGREGSQSRTIAEACAFIDKAPKGNDPLEYIFGDLLETFTADETKVLAALTYFSLPAKLKWLAEMTNLPERAAETALEDLTDRSILTSNLRTRTWFLPPLTAKFIRTRRPEAVTQTGDALTDRAYALAMQYGGDANYEGFRTLDAEWDFVAAALPRLLTGDNVHLQKTCDQLDQFLNFTGRWDDLIWLHEQAEVHALASDDKENAGWRAYQAGVVYSLRSQPAEVLAYASRAAEHWQNSKPRNKAFAIRLRGLGHRLNKDYPAAIAAYREMLEILEFISPESDDVAIALNDLAGAEHANEDYPAAERDYREALRIAKIIKDDKGTAVNTGSLAGLALDREQWAETESLAREALALAEKVGQQEMIAYDSRVLAKALLMQGRSGLKPDLQEVLTLSRRAVEIYTRLRHPNLQWAQEMLAEIEKVISNQ